MLGCVPKKGKYQLWEKLYTLFSVIFQTTYKQTVIIPYKSAAEKVSTTVLLSLQLLKSYFVNFLTEF